MFNYALLAISVVIFLIGIRYSIQNEIITKGKIFVISMITTFFLVYSIFFLASDYFTGNQWLEGKFFLTRAIVLDTMRIKKVYA